MAEWRRSPAAQALPALPLRTATRAIRIGQHPHVATSAPKVDVMDGKRLLLAVPKKGRMNATIIDMLNGAGFDYKRPDRIDIAHCRDLPISIVFLPAADIAT